MSTIALERGLDELKSYLDNQGYKTVYADEIDGNISVYIYLDQNILGQQTFHAALDNSLKADTTSAPSGILLINARNKTNEEIKYMIESRTYSPLFFF
ncbi:MAG TPA: hypothetical protein GX505_11595 [Clostridiales bacterium]|nr:hypothetical protein [Clostridiales bacterium]